jgi:hypothetical protein
MQAAVQAEVSTVSDQLAIVLVVGGITAFVSLATTTANLWFQYKREKDSRAAEVERDHLRHTYDLRRDRQAKLLEVRIQRNREQRQACETLLAAVRQFSIWAGTRVHTYDGDFTPIPTQPDETAAVEDDTYKSAHNRFESYLDESLRVLRTDRDAQTVEDAFDALPRAELKDRPTDLSARKAWLDGEKKLKQAIYDYIGVLDARLDDEGATSASSSSPTDEPHSAAPSPQ